MICYRRNGSVRRIRSAWLKPHRRYGTRDEHKHLDQIYEKEKYVRISLKGTLNFFTVLLKMHFSVRTMFQSERALNL